MPLTLEEIFDSKRFDEKILKQPKWLKNGKLSFVDNWPESEKPTVWLYDPETRGKEPLFDPETLQLSDREKPLEVKGVVWSDDCRRLLLTGEAPARFKPSGDLFLYEVETNSLRQLTRSDAPQYHPKFSPDGRTVGVVRANDLWLTDIETGEERRLTHDGMETLYNGRCGWVYEEELGLADGWAWSPDGTVIAYLQQDESDVPVVLLPRYDQHHAEPEVTRYPKPGDPNPQTRLGLLDVSSGATRWIALPGDEEERYIAAFQWLKIDDFLIDSVDDGTRDDLRGKLHVQRLNRVQDWLELLRIDAQTGDVTCLLVEDDNRWVEQNPTLHYVVDDPDLSDEPNVGILWVSGDDGHYHICRHGLAGRGKTQLTSGPWDVMEVIGQDPEGYVLFTSASPDATQRHLFAMHHYEPGSLYCLTDQFPGWHRATLSEDGKYLLHVYSSLSEPPTTSVRETDGTLLETLVAQREDFLAGVDLLPWEFLTVETGDGETLNARMLKPGSLEPGQRCPAIMYTYGGPCSQSVTNQWGGKRGLWEQYMAQQGYVVFAVDNRGTGGRGRDFMKLVFLRLGELEAEDQIAGARYLQGLGFVDPERIGIWGWSYGGYVSTLCMLRGADVFKAGIAVAPVTDWTLYDSIYTERYMRTPAENPDGYRSGSPVFEAEKLKGKFLLVHGLADDNVHFQHSARLASALQDAKKPFEAMFYPAKRHGIEDRHYHLYSAMTEFWRRSL